MESRDVLAFTKKYWRHPVTVIAGCGIAVLILHLFGLLIPLLRLVFTILLTIAALGLLYSIIRFALRRRALARGEKAQGGSRDNKIGWACGGAAALCVVILLLLPSSRTRDNAEPSVASNRDDNQDDSRADRDSPTEKTESPKRSTQPPEAHPQEVSRQSDRDTSEVKDAKAVKLTDYPARPTGNPPAGDQSQYSFDEIVAKNRRRAEALLPKITVLYADILTLKKYHQALATFTSRPMFRSEQAPAEVKDFRNTFALTLNEYMSGDGRHWVASGDDRDSLDEADLGVVFFHSLAGEKAFREQRAQDSKRQDLDSKLVFAKPKSTGKSEAYRDGLHRIIGMHSGCLKGTIMSTGYEPSPQRVPEAVIIQLKTLPDPDSVLACWNRCRDVFRELHDAYMEMSNSYEPPPAKTKDDGSLVYIGGITHIVNGDEYYIENKVIKIPKKYLHLYSEGSDGANKVGIMGNFRFVGNAKGKNAFGAAVNVELYECDMASAESQLAEEFAKRDPKYRAYREKFLHPEFNEVLEDRPLEAMLLTYRKLVGDEAFNKAIESAK